MQEHFISSDLSRIVRDLIRKGTVAQVKGGKVRVQMGELLTDWLPWSNLRAGKVKISSQPSVGEQCCVFSENGNLGTGVVWLGLNSDANPPAADCGADDLVIDIPESGKLLLRCGSSKIEMTASNITITGTRIDFKKA